MTITDDILIKEISGNATVDEVKLITEWKNLLPENKEHYNAIKVIWENSKIPKPTFNPDLNQAWGNISKQINQPKSFRYLKIAAGLALIIGLSIILKLTVFNSNKTNEENIANNTMQSDIDDNDQKSNIKTYNVTTVDSIKEIFLQDSSLVVLNINSEINYKDFFATNKRKVYLDGQAHFDIVPNKKDFIVVTDFVIVKVIGTSFIVNENKDENTVDVIVEEGKVEAFEAKKSKNKVIILANEKYTYDITTHTFSKNGHHKGKWWKGFFSKLKHIIDRIKHRKHDRE